MMQSSARRARVCSLLAALLATALFAAFLATRAESPLAALADGWDLLLVFAALATFTALTACAALTFLHRRELRRLARDVAAYRLHPPSAPLSAIEGAALLGPLQAELQALCLGYREALGRVVAQEEALESLQIVLGRGDGDRSLTAIQIGRNLGSSRNMVGRLTTNLRWAQATPALQQFLGLAQGELSGKSLADFVPADDLPALRSAFREALEAGEVHNLLFRLRCRVLRPADEPDPAAIEHRPPRDGAPHTERVRERHVQMDVTVRCDESGAPAHFRCFLIDVSDRVRAERELRRRTEELQQTNERLLRINEALQRLKESYGDLYHNAPVMYFSLDPDGCFVGCNDTLLSALGYTREELHQRPYTLLLPPESRATYLRDPSAYQQQGEVETRWAKRDGTVIDVWIRSVPVCDAAGNFVRSRSVAQDVTERNRLADELRRRGDELERANGDLRRTNKELDEFTSMVTHDLKEPLRTIELHSSILASEHAAQMDADCFESVNHILTASGRLGRLIEDLLALSRAGRVATAPRPCDVQAVFATTRRDLADLIARKGAAVRIEGPLPRVNADPERLHQLLLNLIGNGLKYNTAARPEVVVGCAGEADGGRVTLFVRDNGIGIDPRHHREIFRSFRRLHGRDEYEGTGAGLAICKKIIEAHAGKIWVESEPGRGAAFFFTLPQAPVGSAATPPTAPAAAPRPDETKARLLLVEDMHEIAVVVRRLAERAGHALAWVASAEAAWDVLQAHRPDLVLLDINLPGMSGIELCRRLRASAELADVPVALFTQDLDGTQVAEGREAGADFVLAKDLLSRPAAWRRRLAEILAARPAAGGRVSG